MSCTAQTIILFEIAVMKRMGTKFLRNMLTFLKKISFASAYWPTYIREREETQPEMKTKSLFDFGYGCSFRLPFWLRLQFQAEWISSIWFIKYALAWKFYNVVYQNKMRKTEFGKRRKKQVFSDSKVCNVALVAIKWLKIHQTKSRHRA